MNSHVGNEMLRGRERAREEKIVRSWGEKMDGATTVLDEHSRVDASIATREFRKKRKSEKKTFLQPITEP